MLSVPVMRRVLGDTLRGVGVNEDSVSDILLAATEACTNVVLHAGHSAAAFTVAATVKAAAEWPACRTTLVQASVAASRMSETESSLTPTPRNVSPSTWRMTGTLSISRSNTRQNLTFGRDRKTHV